MGLLCIVGAVVESGACELLVLASILEDDTGAVLLLLDAVPGPGPPAVLLLLLLRPYSYPPYSG